MGAPARILGFDFLRGILAIGVMVYHYLAWSKMANLYNLGTYGVYAFFVLSGASMYVAYSARMDRLHDLVPYLVNRIFRIFPLLLAIGIVVPLLRWLARLASGRSVSLDVPLSTILGSLPTFGVTQPGAVGIATGAWSLGIEFVFYAIFPLLLAVFRSGWGAALVCSLVFLVAQVAFVNMVLAQGTFSENWVSYTQYGSFGFYFAFGMLIGKYVDAGGASPGKTGVIFLFVSGLAVLAMSSGATRTDGLTGFTGISLLVLVCCVTAVSAYLPLVGAWARIAHTLGVLSYPVYLLHPVVWHVVGKRDAFGMVTAGVATFALSWLSWRLLEQPAIRLGKRLNLRLSAPMRSEPV